MIGEVDEMLRRQVLQASEIADRGIIIATVVLAALTLAVVFWQAARTRRAAALAEADRRSEARFRSLMQNASDVIVVVEPDTTIVYHSPSAERWLRDVGKGHTRPRLVDVVHQDERTVFLSFIKAVSVADGHNDAVAFRLAAADGGWVDVEVVASNLLAILPSAAWC